MHSKQEKIEFLSRTFGPGLSGADGINYAVRCPSKECETSKKKKLIIRLDNDKHHCWVCGLKGKDLSYTLKKYRPGLYREYAERFLGKRLFGIAADESSQEQTAKIPDKFIFLATSMIDRDPDVRSVVEYAKSRGLGLRDFWRFKLGTCKHGRFRRRLIMPSFDADGELNYFVARSVDKNSTVKYLNAKVPKKNVIFNEINIDWSEELTVVEGPMDLMKCDDNATCLLGSHLNEGYLLFSEIVRHSTPVVLAMDPDARTKAQNIAKKLAAYNVRVRVLEHGNFSDVGEMSRADFKKAKDAAELWNPDDRLYHLIRSIGSGSIL